MAAAGARERGAVNEVAPVILGKHGAGDVHLAAADMGVQIDRTSHHDHAARIDLLVNLRGGTRVHDDATVLDEDIAHLALHPVGRVDDGSALELEQHRYSSAVSIASSASAALGSGDSRSLRSGSATTLSAR